MKSINYKELCEFVNDNKLSIKGKMIRTEEYTETSIKDKDLFANINYESLIDIAELGENLLDYDMEDVILLKMLNFAIKAKHSIYELGVNPANIYLNTSSKGTSPFTIYILVAESRNVISKINISTNREANIEDCPDDKSLQELFYKIKDDFKLLSYTC